VMFKGSGFYETDYKRAGSKPPACEKCDSKKECPAARTEASGTSKSGE